MKKAIKRIIVSAVYDDNTEFRHELDLPDHVVLHDGEGLQHQLDFLTKAFVQDLVARTGTPVNPLEAFKAEMATRGLPITDPSK